MNAYSCFQNCSYIKVPNAAQPHIFNFWCPGTTELIEFQQKIVSKEYPLSISHEREPYPTAFYEAPFSPTRCQAFQQFRGRYYRQWCWLGMSISFSTKYFVFPRNYKKRRKKNKFLITNSDSFFFFSFLSPTSRPMLFPLPHTRSSLTTFKTHKQYG